MLALYLRLRAWLTEQEEGQDLIEYALLIVLIAVVVILAITAVGGKVENVFENINTQLGDVAP